MHHGNDLRGQIRKMRRILLTRGLLLVVCVSVLCLILYELMDGRYTFSGSMYRGVGAGQASTVVLVLTGVCMVALVFELRNAWKFHHLLSRREREARSDTGVRHRKPRD